MKQKWNRKNFLNMFNLIFYGLICFAGCINVRKIYGWPTSWEIPYGKSYGIFKKTFFLLELFKQYWTWAFLDICSLMIQPRNNLVPCRQPWSTSLKVQIVIIISFGVLLSFDNFSSSQVLNKTILCEVKRVYYPRLFCQLPQSNTLFTVGIQEYKSKLLQANPDLFQMLAILKNILKSNNWNCYT